MRRPYRIRSFYADRLGIKVDRIERKSQHRSAPIAIETPATMVEWHCLSACAGSASVTGRTKYRAGLSK
jgi:hypothetical protein